MMVGSSKLQGKEALWPPEISKLGGLPVRVTLQIEGPEMKPSPDRSALFRLSGHGGETHIASWAEDTVKT